MAPKQKFESVIETANNTQWQYDAAKLAGGVVVAGVSLSALHRAMQKSRKEAQLAIEAKILSTTSWQELNELQALLFPYKYGKSHVSLDWLTYLALDREYYIIEYKPNESITFATRYLDQELVDVLPSANKVYKMKNYRLTYSDKERRDQYNQFPPFVIRQELEPYVYKLTTLKNGDPARFLYTAWTGPGGGLFVRVKNWFRGNIL